MKHFDRGVNAKRAAGLGLSILMLPAVFGRACDAQAADDGLANSQSSAEQAIVASKTDCAAPKTVIRTWPRSARVAAAALIDEYGDPVQCTKVVYQSRFLGKRNKDIVEQSIAYRVPFERIDDLKRFDGRLVVDAVDGRLLVRSTSESKNFLAMNIADEIISGARGVDDGRAFFAKTLALSKAGKSSPYTDRFLFPSRDGMRTKELHQIPYEWNTLP